MTTAQPTGTLTVARVEAGRLLRRTLRDPVTTGEAVVFPVLLLVVLETVFGRRITALTGVDALLGLVPMAALLAVMNSSPAAAVALRAERDGGVLARLWVHPVRRGGLLLGRALAEIGRSVVIVLVVFAAGVALGLRVSSPWAAAVMLLLSVLWAAAYAMVAVTVALNVGPAAEMLALPAALLAFFSTGFVPLEAFPTILQPIVARQPITVIVDAMRTVAGGSVGLDVWGPAALWSLALGAVFCVPAARAFRRASRWTGAA